MSEGWEFLEISGMNLRLIMDRPLRRLGRNPRPFCTVGIWYGHLATWVGCGAGFMGWDILGLRTRNDSQTAHAVVCSNELHLGLPWGCRALQSIAKRYQKHLTSCLRRGCRFEYPAVARAWEDWEGIWVWKLGFPGFLTGFEIPKLCETGEFYRFTEFYPCDWRYWSARSDIRTKALFRTCSIWWRSFTTIGAPVVFVCCLICMAWGQWIDLLFMVSKAISIDRWIDLSVYCPSIDPSIHRSIDRSIHPSIHPSIYTSVYITPLVSWFPRCLVSRGTWPAHRRETAIKPYVWKLRGPSAPQCRCMG